MTHPDYRAALADAVATFLNLWESGSDLEPEHQEDQLLAAADNMRRALLAAPDDAARHRMLERLRAALANGAAG